MEIAGSLHYDTKIDTKGIDKGLKEIDGKTKNVSQAMNVALGNIISNLSGIAVSGLKEIAKSGVEYNAQIETYQTALTTLLGSAEAANKTIEQIKIDAAKTPFDVSGLVQANQLLISAGVSSEDSREDILALGNAISATGGGNEELSRMAVNLQQIKNVGKASALDIKQFAYAGIDVYGLLADSMGITREEAAELEIGYDELTGALKYAADEGGRYAGAMEKQSTTFNGQMSNLKDNLDSFLGEALKPLFDFLKDSVLPLINDALTGGEKIREFIKEHSTLLTILAGIVGTFTAALIAYTIAQNAAAIATAIMTTASTAFGAVMAFITSPITLVVLAIGAVITIGYLLVKNWDKIKETANRVFTWIADFFKGISDKISGFFSGMYDTGKNIVYGIWNGIKDAKDWLLNKIRSFSKSITNGIKGFFGIHSPSRVMQEEVGQWLPKGIAVGIEANTDSVEDAADEMNDKLLDKVKKAVNVNAGEMAYSGTNGSITQLLSAYGTTTVLNENKLYLDGDQIFENQEKVKAKKELQTQFGGGYSVSS